LILTIVTTLVALISALAIPDIKIVFGLIGATVSHIISYIMPAIFYLHILRNTQFLDLKASKWRWMLDKNAIYSIILLVLGIFFGVVSTVVTLINIIKGEEEE